VNHAAEIISRTNARTASLRLGCVPISPSELLLALYGADQLPLSDVVNVKCSAARRGPR
jgi:hypothetical protein